MFGTYRFTLAVAVMVQHLLTIPAIGDHALHGFFLLSGFLMTRVLNDTYGHRKEGITAFLANRILRLYPIYWAVLGISAIIVLTFGETASRQYRHFIYLPTTAPSILQNLTLIFPSWLPGTMEPRLSPPTWSLTVELFYYVLMAAGASVNRLSTFVWLSASVMVLVLLNSNDPRYLLYKHLGAQSLPFALGAMLYHCHDGAARIIRRFPILLRPTFPVGLIIVNTLATSALVIMGTPEIQAWGALVNLSLHLGLIACLNDLRVPAPYRSVDRFLGDLAYPVFLLHWQIGFAVSMLLFGQPIRGASINGLAIYLVALVASCTLAALLVAVVDQPVQKMRDRVRLMRSLQDNKHGKPGETPAA